MAIYKCKMCGGALEVNQNESVATCEYCGTQQTVSKTDNDILLNLFNRANNLRLKCEFDKAAQIYEKIIEQDDSDAEAHWGLVLCKYGIEYVEDPKTLQRVPTCHRTSFDAVVTDVDYQAAIDYSDASQQVIYEREARAIDKIQKDILEIVKNEKPFDIFICYKETDESGKRTIDSSIANDIYHQLTLEGFKVFYAAITLEDKLGQEYEPYIFAALNSAKVMLVLGTKVDYFNAVWVKNEWSRFLGLMKGDRTKLLIPCYRDMDAYDLPEEFAHLQSQDMSKIGFINDVVRGIKKVVQVEEVQTVTSSAPITVGANNNVEPLLKRAFMSLEDKEWAKADEFCEQVLNQDPENAMAYLVKLMAELRVSKQGELKNLATPFDQSNDFKKIIRFADEELRTELNGYIKYINDRNEKERLDGIYNKAKKMMTESTSENAYKEAAALFESVVEYQDSAVLSKECHKKAEVLRKDTILAKGKVKMLGSTISNCEDAIKMFESIPGWKDADELICVCQKKIEEIKEKLEAERLECERQAERIAERNRKIAIITALIACAIAVFTIVLCGVIIPNGKYNHAIALMNEEKYTEAIKAFEAMDGYKDSKKKISECKTAILDGKYNDAIAQIDKGKTMEAYKALLALGGYKDSADKAKGVYNKYKAEWLKKAKAGDYVYFGVYEQDNDKSNGKENIEWLVLEVKDGKVFVISKDVLDCKQYNTKHMYVTWETCTLRQWLNDNFINTAFSTEEKAIIPTVTVSAHKDPKDDADPGKTTQDRVFLLSTVEKNMYFGGSGGGCKPTAFAIASGAHVDNENCYWWLRTPCELDGYNFCVHCDGEIYDGFPSVNVEYVGVRPAMWIEIK